MALSPTSVAVPQENSEFPIDMNQCGCHGTMQKNSAATLTVLLLLSAICRPQSFVQFGNGLDRACNTQWALFY